MEHKSERYWCEKKQQLVYSCLLGKIPGWKDMSGWRDPHGGSSWCFRMGVADKYGMTPFLGEKAESFKREPFTGFVSMNIST